MLLGRSLGKRHLINGIRRYSTAFLNQQTQDSRIDNGVRVVSESKPGQTAAISVVVNTGSGHETIENNGVAHFLEHLAFKGTKNRSKHELELQIENMGGSLNAFTSREHTVYITKVFKQDVEKAVDILSDIIQNSNYEPSDIEYEKHVILREMEEINKCVDELMMDRLHEISFDGSLAYTILGPESNIKKFTRDDIVDYVKSYYSSKRIAVAAVGAVDHDELVDLTSKYFTNVSQSSARDIDMLPNSKFKGGYENINSNITANSCGIIAYEGASWTSADMIPLLIIQTLVGNFDFQMGSGVLSNLAQRVAMSVGHKNCEKITSFVTSYCPTGIVGCTFSAKTNDLEPLVSTIVKGYADLANSISEDDVESAKHRLKSSLSMMYDGITPVCEDLGRQIWTIGRRLPLQEFFDRIDLINRSHIIEICARYFQNVAPSLVTLGKDVKHIEHEKLKEIGRL